MKKEFRFTNHLINETSPYLLQHAHNPVDWFPWGEESLAKAKKEDKPILVSIGYAACHWCHVMEHESFEDEETATFMNENFINIKIDREERPDIDQIYMDAVQLLTGSGGWPLNVFLTPDKKPFYGGTYFPPEPAYNRASWMQILMGVKKIFNERREEIEMQGEKITKHLTSGDIFSRNKSREEGNQLTKQHIENAFQNLRKNFDKINGGFGNAPKFPGTFSINFLVRYAHYTKNNEALTHAILSLDKMCTGGIYDQLGGGFARYSTDAEWMVPHFEKMLYDNALLMSTLSDAYKITHKKLYRDTISQTLGFVQRELMSREGGFYSSLDADSEGEEGKFYVWSKKEIDELLKDDSFFFCEVFGVTAEGNWENKNILHLNSGRELSKDDEERIHKAKSILFHARKKRTHPALDDKIILSWNALMCSAFVNGCSATGEIKYLRIAEQNLSFLLQSFRCHPGQDELHKDNWAFYHNYKNRKGFNYAFLDDYALLIQAMLDLYEVNFNPQLIFQATEITEYVLQHFYDESHKLFFYTSDLQTDLLLRKKESSDSATPSGNSVMASNLIRLSVMLDNKKFSSVAEQMFPPVLNAAEKYPSAFSNWLSIMTDKTEGQKEVAIVGDEYLKFAEEINHLFIPNKVIMASEEPVSELPLLADKHSKNGTLIYLCENYSCKAPVNSVEKFKQQLSGN